MKEKLLGKTLQELKEAAVNCGLKPFVGTQLADWLYAKRAGSWDRMVNISKAGREALAERYDLGVSAPVGSAVSSDGTKKYLFEVTPTGPGAPKEQQAYVEAVMISSTPPTFSTSSSASTKRTSSPTPCSWGWANRSTTTTPCRAPWRC